MVTLAIVILFLVMMIALALFWLFLTEVLPWIILIYLMYLVIKCAVIALIFYLACLVIKRAFSDKKRKANTCG